MYSIALKRSYRQISSWPWFSINYILLRPLLFVNRRLLDKRTPSLSFSLIFRLIFFVSCMGSNFCFCLGLYFRHTEDSCVQAESRYCADVPLHCFSVALLLAVHNKMEHYLPANLSGILSCFSLSWGVDSSTSWQFLSTLWSITAEDCASYTLQPLQAWTNLIGSSVISDHCSSYD